MSFYKRASAFLFDAILLAVLAVGLALILSAVTGYDRRAAEMEKLLEDGINSIGLGPQGMSGCASVMGVHIENTARHPSTIGVAVNVGCWSHRRGLVRFDRDLNATVISHKGVTL